MSPQFIHLAGKAWSSAHRLISDPEQLREAQEQARGPESGEGLVFYPPEQGR